MSADGSTRRRRERLARLLAEIEETEELAETGDGTIEDLIPDDRTATRSGSVEILGDDAPVEVDALPIPKPWQGLQRAAVVYNFNFVWDSGKEQWVRDEGNGGSTGGVSVIAEGVLTTRDFGGTYNVLTGVQGASRLVWPVCTFDDVSQLPPTTDTYINPDYGNSAIDNLRYSFGYSTPNDQWIISTEQDVANPIDVKWRVLELNV